MRLLSRSNDEVVEKGQEATGRNNGVVRRHCLGAEVMVKGELVRSIRDAVLDFISTEGIERRWIEQGIRFKMNIAFQTKSMASRRESAMSRRSRMHSAECRMAVILVR